MKLTPSFIFFKAATIESQPATLGRHSRPIKELPSAARQSTYASMEARDIPLNTPIKPDGTLLKYYFAYSLLWVILFPVVFVVKYIRYRTLRYLFTDEEITMSWGGIEKQSISVSYERIQDIQLSSGPLERQFSLAKVQLQTASGDARSEIILEGFLNPAAVRDQLYEKIQRVKNLEPVIPPATPLPSNEPNSAQGMVETLRQIAEELIAIRSILADKTKGK